MLDTIGHLGLFGIWVHVQEKLRCLCIYVVWWLHVDIHTTYSVSILRPFVACMYEYTVYVYIYTNGVL